MSASSRVILSHDVSEFFRDQVSEARDVVGVKMSDHTEYYLVRLLCDYTRRDSGAALGEEALALIYKRALEANLTERVQLLKSMGDMALYISGFFVEFVEKSMVDVDYYISMGGTAYSNLSGLVGAQRHGETFAELYQTLAVRFTDLVDVLNQIADQSREKPGSDADLLKLYDRWARTGSERIRKMLLERGLVPSDQINTDYVQ